MDVNFSNFIGIFDNAFSEDYCNSVVEWFEYMDKCGYTSRRNTSKIHKDDTQFFHENDSWVQNPNHNIHIQFNNIFWSQIHPLYVDKYEILSTLDKYSIFTNKLQRTDIGQGYHLWHCESSKKGFSSRILAYTLYLNTVEEGGETEFLYYPLRIKPQVGKFIIWPAGFTHTHRGNPPISNTKYIMTGWVEY